KDDQHGKTDDDDDRDQADRRLVIRLGLRRLRLSHRWQRGLSALRRCAVARHRAAVSEPAPLRGGGLRGALPLSLSLAFALPLPLPLALSFFGAIAQIRAAGLRLFDRAPAHDRRRGGVRAVAEDRGLRKTRRLIAVARVFVLELPGIARGAHHRRARR